MEEKIVPHQLIALQITVQRQQCFVLFFFFFHWPLDPRQEIAPFWSNLPPKTFLTKYSCSYDALLRLHQLVDGAVEVSPHAGVVVHLLWGILLKNEWVVGLRLLTHGLLQEKR